MNNQEDKIELQRQKAREVKEDLDFLDACPQFQRVITEGYIMDTLINQSEGMLDMNPAIRQSTMEAVMSANYLRRALEAKYEDAMKTLAYEG